MTSADVGFVTIIICNKTKKPIQFFDYLSENGIFEEEKSSSSFSLLNVSVPWSEVSFKTSNEIWKPNFSIFFVIGCGTFVVHSVWSEICRFVGSLDLWGKCAPCACFPIHLEHTQYRMVVIMNWLLTQWSHAKSLTSFLSILQLTNVYTNGCINCVQLFAVCVLPNIVA